MKFVRNLLDRLGRPDLVPFCERGPGPHQQPVIEFLARRLPRASPLAHWRAWFAGSTSASPRSTRCARPSTTIASARRGLVLKDELGREHIAPVVRFLHEPAEPSLREPRSASTMSLACNADHSEP